MSADPKHAIDVDALVRGLGSPEPELAPPPWPEEELGWWDHVQAFFVANPIAWAPVLAAAVVLVLVALPGGDAVHPSPGLRGTDEAPDTWLSLNLLVQQDGQTQRLGELAQVRVGDRAFFRVAAGAEMATTVWVQTPSGVETIGQLAASTETADLRSGEGLTAYRFDAPGTYTFFASPEAETCEPPVCAEQRVEVK
ncbi:MAG: hypothetical protein H6740_00960 [Alphaproteobacteria bacterium]|nr:hypothetical protein [Alphaproteobacteria bacterium]